VPADACAEELAALPLDFERYVAAEPRLTSARWITQNGPEVGARAEVVADIPFTVQAVRRLIGRQCVTATLIDWRPGHSLAADFEGASIRGWTHVEVEQAGEVSVVRVDGAVEPKRAPVRVALRPLHPALAFLATRAIERGVARAAAAVSGPSPTPDS
jgi:polyketide cyclase/dehydrase/lipid transport protein